VVHLVGHAALIHSGDRVAAADDFHGVGIRHGLGDGLGADVEAALFEHAHGAVPDDGAGAGEFGGELLDGAVADVDALAVGGDGASVAPGFGDFGGRVVAKLGGVAGVDGQEEFHAFFLGLAEDLQ